MAETQQKPKPPSSIADYLIDALTAYRNAGKEEIPHFLGERTPQEIFDGLESGMIDPDDLDGLPDQVFQELGAIKVAADQKRYDALIREVPALGPDQEVVNEQHPAVGNLTRLGLLNFTKNQDVQRKIKYLKEKFPDMEIYGHEGKLDGPRTKGVLGGGIHSGQIFMRAPGEKKWHVLDPAPTEFPEFPDAMDQVVKGDFGGFNQAFSGAKWGELGKDIGDEAYNLLSGLLTTKAAVGATAATRNPKAGKLAAGAVAGSGEYLRQLIGKHLVGLDQEPSLGDAVFEGGVAGLLPFVTGSGITKNEILQEAAKRIPKGTLKNAPTMLAEKRIKDRAYESVAREHRGIPQQLWEVIREKVFPVITEMGSGAPRETVRTLRRNMDTLREVERNSSLTPMVDQVRRNLIKAAGKDKTSAGKALQTFRETSPAEIDLIPAQAPFYDSMAEIGALKDIQAPHKEMISNTEGLRKWFFGEPMVPQGPLNLPGLKGSEMVMPEFKVPFNEAYIRQDLLQNAVKGHATGARVPIPVKGQSYDTVNANQSLIAAKDIINQSMNLAEPKYKGLKKAYADVMERNAELGPLVKSKRGFEQKLRTAGLPTNRRTAEIFNEIDAKHNTGVGPLSEFMPMHAIFGNNPSLGAINTTSAPATGKAVVAASVGGSLGRSLAEQMQINRDAAGAAGKVLGMFVGSPAAVRGYSVGMDKAENIARTLQDVGVGPINLRIPQLGALQLWNHLLQRSVDRNYELGDVIDEKGNQRPE